jgi:hypothetical protein
MRALNVSYLAAVGRRVRHPTAKISDGGVRAPEAALFFVG